MDRETLDEVLRTIRDFGKRELTREICLSLDERDECPVALIRRMMGPDLGLHLVFLPESAGGLGGGAYDVYRVSRELAEIDLGVATAFFAISLGTDPIAVGGTPDQKARWMGRIASEALIVAYGVTEPTAGSEVSAARTRAARETDSAGNVTGYVIDGTKQFITNGGIADLYTVLARTPDGLSFFVVEKGTPGLSPGAHEKKHGIRASDTTQVVLDGVRVPAENLVGGVEGVGLKQAQQVFGYTRLMVAAFGLGAGIAAMRLAIAYAKDRVQYGSPLIAKQGYTHGLLVPHAVALEASRAYIEEVAGRLDAGAGELSTEGAIAKLVATEAGNAAADAAMQAHGGYGYTRDYLVEKIRRDVRITTIYEGTSEIMRNTIAMDRWRDSIQSRLALYDDLAAAMDRLDREDPGVGAGSVALAARTLNRAIAIARERRLTRKQHVVFLLGDMVAGVETAASLSRRAAAIRSGAEAPDPMLMALDGESSGAIARQWARRAAWEALGRAAYAMTWPPPDGTVAQAAEPAVDAGSFFGILGGAEADMDLLASRLRES